MCVANATVVPLDYPLPLKNETPFIKLKEIELIVNHYRLVPKLSRQEEIVLARLRIGHTRVTHSWLLKHEEQPFFL